MSDLHDIPDAASLVEAVREFLERDVLSATEGRIQFHTRVAVNVLRMVERELELGDGMAEAHERGLALLGVADEAALAAAIREGSLDSRMEEVRQFVVSTVRAKLKVANPAYLEGPRPPVP